MSRHRTLRKKLLDSESEDEDEYYQEEVEFTPPKAAKSKSKASSRRQQSKTGESLSWKLKKRIIEAIDNPLSPGNLCDICDRSPDIFGAKASALRRSVQRFVDNYKRKKTAEAAQLFRDKVFRKAAIEAESANPFESLDLTSAPFTQYRTPCSPTSSPEVEKKPMSSRTPRKKTPTRNNGRMSAHIMPGAPIPDNAGKYFFVVLFTPYTFPLFTPYPSAGYETAHCRYSQLHVYSVYVSFVYAVSVSGVNKCVIVYCYDINVLTTLILFFDYSGNRFQP